MDVAVIISESPKAEGGDRCRRSGKASGRWAMLGFFDLMKRSGSGRGR
jgi:hypothetical protein